MEFSSEQVLEHVVKAMESKKAARIVSLELKEVSLIADYFVIAHGNSDTQVLAIANAVRDAAEENGFPLRSIQGLDAARWVLIDLGDVVCHIFHRDEREYYGLESLWSDAKAVEYA
jgi:ribosome-associated protein